MKGPLCRYCRDAAMVAALVIAGCSTGKKSGIGGSNGSLSPIVVTPAPVGETTPVPHGRDAADDPAIWINPSDPSKSLVIGTDKKGGLLTYTLDGAQRQMISEGSQPNNVDVLTGFQLGSEIVDLAVAGCRIKDAEGHHTGGLKIWAIDRASGDLRDVTAGGYQPALVKDGKLGAPYGSTVYRSARSKKPYLFVNDKEGHVEQHELHANANGHISTSLVRSFSLPSQVEGCVCDDARGVLYIAEEAVGIWRFDAEPDGSPRGVLIARVGENGLTADVEGLTIYEAPGGDGYLIASSQGSNTFKVYERVGDNRFIATIDPIANTHHEPPIGDVEETDGIAVTSTALGDLFPDGMLVVQDGKNEPDHQNFKMYRWGDVAGGVLTCPIPKPR